MSLITRSSDNSTLTAVIDKENKVDKDGDSETIRDLAKFKSLKNSAECKKSIKY